MRAVLLQSGSWSDRRILRICAVSLLLTLSAIGLFLYRPRSDFSMFHATGRQWRTGSAVYTAEQPNLNPPFAVVTLFAPISLLPYRAACILWIGLGCVAVGASARIVARTLNWPGRHAAVAFACVLLTYPAWLVWFQGQMIWLLLYPATLAWRAMREKRHVAAGLWLGPVIALKPPLALAAFVLPWRVWISAGIGSAALTGLSVLWTGPAVWRDWWRFRDAVFWLGLPDNASFLGVVSRAKSGVLLSGGLDDHRLVALHSGGRSGPAICAHVARRDSVHAARLGVLPARRGGVAHRQLAGDRQCMAGVRHHVRASHDTHADYGAGARDGAGGRVDLLSRYINRVVELDKAAALGSGC